MDKYSHRECVYVGLDYHQHAVQVCVMDSAGNVLGNGTRANDVAEIRAAAEWLGLPVVAAIESCPGAACLAEQLQWAGWSVSLAHATYVARIKQSPDKTDWQDARLLADLVRVGYLPRVWLAPECVRELRRVVRYRQGLSRERRAVKLRIRAVLRELRLTCGRRAWTCDWHAWLAQAPLTEQARWVVEQHLRRLKALDMDIKAAEQRLAALTKDDPFVQFLLGQAGIGLITAVTLRAELGRADRFRSGKQMARFCGLTPRNASSGSRQADAGLIKAGNDALRAVLIEAAHRLRRCDLRWHAFGARLQKAGKPHNVIVAAIANRWIRGLYHPLYHLVA